VKTLGAVSHSEHRGEGVRRVGAESRGSHAPFPIRPPRGSRVSSLRNFSNFRHKIWHGYSSVPIYHVRNLLTAWPSSCVL